MLQVFLGTHMTSGEEHAIKCINSAGLGRMDREEVLGAPTLILSHQTSEYIEACHDVSVSCWGRSYSTMLKFCHRRWSERYRWTFISSTQEYANFTLSMRAMELVSFILSWNFLVCKMVLVIVFEACSLDSQDSMRGLLFVNFSGNKCNSFLKSEDNCALLCYKVVFHNDVLFAERVFECGVCVPSVTGWARWRLWNVFWHGNWPCALLWTVQQDLPSHVPHTSIDKVSAMATCNQ